MSFTFNSDGEKGWCRAAGHLRTPVRATALISLIHMCHIQWPTGSLHNKGHSVRDTLSPQVLLNGRLCSFINQVHTTDLDTLIVYNRLYIYQYIILKNVILLLLIGNLYKIRVTIKHYFSFLLTLPHLTLHTKNVMTCNMFIVLLEGKIRKLETNKVNFPQSQETFLEKTNTNLAFYHRKIED